MEAGLKIFRALLAADLDLDKKTGDEGRLLVLFFYTDERKRASELAKGSLRVTVGRATTEAQVDAFVDALARVVARLREPAAVGV